MRVVLDGLHLDTATYAEGNGITFTFFTDDEDLGLALNEALDSAARVLELRRGDEGVPVRVREHEVTPPYSRRYSGAIHRHSVSLEQAGAAVMQLQTRAYTSSAGAIAAR